MATWPGLQTSKKFLEKFEPPDYLIDRILQRGYLYTATGMTGSGKTAVWLRIAAHVALGLPINGITVQQGTVLYLAGENPTDVQMRWAALAREMDFNPNTIPVYFVPGAFSLDEWMTAVREHMEAHGPLALVIVDTQQAFFTGDNENDNQQMVAFAERLRDFINFLGKPAVVVPSHPAKNSARTAMPRGGSAFLNSVDGNFSIKRKTEEPYVRLHWAEKFRGPPFEEIKFELKRVEGPFKDSYGRDLPSIISAPISPEAARALDMADDADMQTLLQALRDFPGAGYRRLAQELEWFAEGGSLPNRSRVWRSMKKLEANGHVQITKKGWKLLSQPNETD